MKVTFRSLLDSGATFVGTYIMFPGDMEIEVMRMAGYDFLMFDMEHDRLTFSEIMPMLRTCDAVGMATVIRVPGVDDAAIKKALDMGASCVKVPDISTAEQAREVVRYSKYKPEGTRGACPFVRAAGYGIDRIGCYERANAETTVYVIIEGPEGIKNMAEIIAVPGIDSISVGQVDLSVALGVPGQAFHPKVIQAVLDCADLCAKYGKSCSGQVTKTEDAKLYKGHKGITHFHTDLPPTLLYRACKQLCDGLRANARQECKATPLDIFERRAGQIRRSIHEPPRSRLQGGRREDHAHMRNGPREDDDGVPLSRALR